MRLLGYADRFSVAPGETIRFMVSCDGPKSYDARIVRLIHGDTNPAGPGYRDEEVPADANGSHRGRRQETRAGSYILVPAMPALAALTSFTVAAMIWPTTPAKGRQGIVTHWDAATRRGWALVIDEGGSAALLLGDGQSEPIVGAGAKLLPREWYCVGASFDATSGRTVVWQQPLRKYAGVVHGGENAGTAPGFVAGGGPLTIAAWADGASPKPVAAGHFNGKIESPRLLSRAVAPAEGAALARDPAAAKAPDIVAAWDFSRDMTSTRIRDLSANRLHGRTVNLPARAMKGHNWTGAEMNWTRAPGQYGAIHFHDDDLYDAGWKPDFAFTVPEGLRSGIYAAKLSADGEEDHIPFFVRPKRGTATADIAFLAPTASYMAYANDHNAVNAAGAEMLMGRLIVLQRQDLHVAENRELGGALYDSHSDGSGVCHSSRLRPILNMRPKYASWLGASGSGLWQFNADLDLIDWLEVKGFRHDVITDEDLHAEGHELLARYRVVLTGSHPEYCTTEMLDAVSAYTANGGRLMYLGANGFYWRIAYHKDLPGAIEVRRGEGGIRTWAAEPGEYYQGFNGEYGGLWRRQGRPPQMLTGVGFTAQGFDLSSSYRRMPGSFDPRAAFIFQGIGAEERIGDFGLVGGGAAGLELDRADNLLGTPPHALVLASSEGHTDLYMVVCEEILVNAPNLTGSQSELVRADMVFFETPAGGAVFSTGSIAWIGSLSHNGYANNVSRITENVLRRFLDPAPLPAG
jgi:N,N-dimethylformamidase